MSLLKSAVSVNVVIASLLAVALPVGARAAEPEVASLYGPQPPADALLVRVVNLASQTARVVLPGSERATTVAPGAVTRFSVVTAGMPLRVAVDGQTVMDVKDVKDEVGRIAVIQAASTGEGAPASAITVALERDARGWHATRVAGSQQRVDGLKATLHALNFVQGCAARIAVDGNGPVVFPQIESDVQRDRAINTVTAKLVGSCGGASSQALTLPPLVAGDSYSLFLSGDRVMPVLTGTRDTVAWPPAGN
jgi:hypothetical protein